MTKKKTAKALLASVLALVLCLSMLVGTTFAWFTDAVVTGMNTIAAGNLDVELYHSNAVVTDEQVETSTKLFMNLQGDPILWEPGVVSYENLRVTNAGDLTLAYQLAINTANENFVVDASGAKYGLSQILKVGVVEGGIIAADRVDVVESVEETNWATLAEFLRSGKLFPEGAGETEKTWGIVIYWEPGENDNLWNLNNGKQLSEGDVLTIDLGIRLIATQEQFENDSFGSDYDEMAKKDVLPEFEGGSASVTVVPNDQNQTASEVVMTSGGVKAVVPAGVQLAQGATQLVMAVSVMAESGANVVLGETDAMRSLDVHIEGISPDNTVPITVTLEEVAPVGLNMGNYKLYHVENGATVEMTLVDSAADFTSHNQFRYDPATGDVVLYMATFSEVTVVADTTKAWNGDVDHSWYVGKDSPYSIANADQLWSFSQIVGNMAESIAQDSFNGKTVMLVSDINLDDAEESNKSFIFYPIGYNCSDGKYEKTGEKVTTGFYTFEGTFDGQGHSIANFYQNTWEMKGDNEYYAASEQYYRDGMGLFGKVYGGTVKNLTVKNFKSDGEYTTTGVIAAYADSRTDKSAVLENIAIVDCNPRVYNTGNGGIVGCGGWYSKDSTTSMPITFRNITVDKTNKISALWGSYDVACGGIMGQYYPNSGCGVKFENCNMAAQMDVYNDVCGNYQYYAYRYAGMMIGSIRNNLPADENGHVYPDMAGITASNCTVNFGDWNDYYYCEFVKNGHPSYSGPDDYKFSRVPNSEIDTANGKENATCIGHDHTGVEDNQAVYLPFTQLFTGYGWGVTSKGLKDFKGITTIQITESDQNEAVVKFESKFTGDFLYRVGNQNTVNIGSLFDVVKNEDGTPRYTINSSGVIVTIDNYEKDANVGGTFKADTSDWTKGTIQFSGTGLVKITIQDYNYCTPTELIVEVVDAKNATSAISATSCNVVLLNDVTNGSFSVSAPYGFYGNGFTITLNPGSHSATKGNGYTGYITMNGGILDNVRIDGPVFAESNIYQSQALPSGTTNSGSIADYFKNAVIVIGGNPAIRNSYISGARTAVCVKAGGNVVIKNTRISGGAYANIEVLSANSLKLMNVTTEQKELKDSYGTNKNVIGTGVVINNAETKVILDGLTQYNWMTKTQWEGMLGDYTSAFPKLFDSSYANLQYSNSGTTYVNTGIIWACEVANPSIEGEIAGYDVTSVKLGTVTGAVYTKTKNTGDSGSLTNKDITAPDYESDAQDAVPPTTTFDYTSKNNEPEQSGSNDYCYYNTDSKKFMISFDEGESKNWHSDILTVTKGTAELPYTVTVSGEATVNADGTITFSKAGDYTVTYTYTDTYNYKQSNGDLVAYEKTYYQYVYVTVFVVEPESDPTTFVFGNDGYKTVTAGGLAYVMPNVTAEKEPTKSSNVVTASGIGSKTIDGETIYYPIIGMHKVGSSWGYYNYFSIFEAVKITDANGTEYSVSTNNVPSNLQVIGGFINNGTESANGTAIFNYSTGKTIKTKSVTVKGTSVGLCYYPDSSFSSSTSARDEQTIVVKYCYTDTNGKAYYYYIGYWCAQGSRGVESSSDSCLAAGSMITMADGRKKAVEDVRKGDIVMAFDHATGQIVCRDVLIVGKTYADSYYKNVFVFDDGTELAAINEHGIYDLDLKQYMNVDHSNYREYIGHRFASVDAQGNIRVKRLVDVVTTIESGYKYDIVTDQTLNYVAEDTLSVSHEIVDIMNSFVFGDDMRYDAAAMKADIAKYGLYTYEDFAAYCEREVFEQYNMAMMKVGVGKGIYTKEHLVYLLTEIALNENVQIVD